MNILVDENMPYATELFASLGKVRAVAGRTLCAAQLADCDALMVRSVTKVNAALLAQSPVKFVGTATAGVDHVDVNWLNQAGIAFAAAPGCNARAVVEYVMSALLTLAQRDGFRLADRCVGIVGVGNVGSRLSACLQAWGVKVLHCDPPRARRGDAGDFLPLNALLEAADVLSFHTPLIQQGEDQTWHLVNADLLRRLRPDTILINSCRGEVVDNQALLSHLQSGARLSVVLDVWQNEPNINLDLLRLVDIATPHIAGYSLEGKARGTTQIFTAFSQFSGCEQQVSLASLLPIADISRLDLHGELTQSTLKRLAHLVYDVRRDDLALRRIAWQAGEFDRLRKQYYPRREWSSLSLNCDNAHSATQLNALGFGLITPPIIHNTIAP